MRTQIREQSFGVRYTLRAKDASTVRHVRTASRVCFAERSARSPPNSRKRPLTNANSYKGRQARLRPAVIVHASSLEAKPYLEIDDAPAKCALRLAKERITRCAVRANHV